MFQLWKAGRHNGVPQKYSISSRSSSLQYNNNNNKKGTPQNTLPLFLLWMLFKILFLFWTKIQFKPKQKDQNSRVQKKNATKSATCDTPLCISVWQHSLIVVDSLFHEKKINIFNQLWFQLTIKISSNIWVYKY